MNLTMRTVCWLLAGVALAVAPSAGRADRIVLAPKAKTVLPGAVAAEWAAASVDGGKQIARLALGIPKNDLGVEVEYERFRSGGRSADALSAQYSILGEAFTNFLAPAISVGVRDMANSGRQGRAYYLALSRTIGFSELQEKLLGSLRIHAGVGTNRMGGAYIGADLGLPGGLNLAAEVVGHRLNARARMRVLGPVMAEALSLDGQGYLGASVSVSR
ncbi:MAG: hypothetical protein NT029_05590 [Armatimonadetes bacterium]|nr:hypothetical protein [Armatimonadota bacterium]